MKIQITLDQPLKSGYKKASINDTFFNGQLSEIYCPDILDSLTLDEIEEKLTLLLEYLGSGGKIIVGGTDVYIMADAIKHRNQTISNINHIIFSGKIRRSFTSLGDTKKFLEKLGCKIQSADLDMDTFSYVLEAIKE